MPRAAIRRAVDMSNAVQPDLAVLTGDLISNEHGCRSQTDGF
jgi:hypothetical protein